MIIIIDLGAPLGGLLRGPPAVSGGVRVSSTNLLASSQQQELVGLLQALQRWSLSCIYFRKPPYVHIFAHSPFF